MKDTTVKMWLSLCSEALLYLLDETDVFYHMPALSEDFSILRNMQPFCNLNQGKESEWKKKKRKALLTTRFVNIKRHGWFRSQLESQLSHLLPITETDVPLAVNCCY